VRPMSNTAQLEKPLISAVHKDLLARILASEQFSRAPRLQRFLTYITDCYFRDQIDEITEQQIGVHVFDKPTGYNPGDDNVVRSYARTLRKRLEEYFAGEGHDEPLMIEVPRGGYVPVFVERPIVVLAELPSPVSDDHNEKHNPAWRQEATEVGPSISPPVRSRTAYQLILWIVSLIVVSVVSCILAFRAGHRDARIMSPPAVDAFWRQFAGGQSTMLVPSDTGLTIILGLTKKGVTVPQYVTGGYVSGQGDQNLLPEGWANTNVHRYTDLIDVKVISAISHLPELPPDQTTIRYARDLRVDDLKEGNAVLIGGANADPWVQLFDQQLNFALQFVPEERNFLVLNRKPKGGELSVYPYGPENWSQISYGLIALRPSISGNGHVLIIEGVAAAGLQGAAEYLLNEETMAPLLPQITDTKGNLRPFEILLRTNNVGANSTKTEIIGMRLD
jgi:hypothetical protein